MKMSNNNEELNDKQIEMIKIKYAKGICFKCKIKKVGCLNYFNTNKKLYCEAVNNEKKEKNKN